MSSCFSDNTSWSKTVERDEGFPDNSRVHDGDVYRITLNGEDITATRKGEKWSVEGSREPGPWYQFGKQLTTLVWRVAEDPDYQHISQEFSANSFICFNGKQTPIIGYNIFNERPNTGPHPQKSVGQVCNSDDQGQ
ncbi:uncharacterized protein I206_103641 [Kwoniella pini CBS 10737]|uniref:Uncharacterized protein n=1 Tax=Kwoniella pini CBS 10737 TaxID=1296096 RepID=A0A1B9I8Z4_9TREE|nr:uncharacterized protein I206_01357 [Kwoniella pini CBS 10737]OCF52072.1 hypothetical protein I206_01357 [Kwoniella pini CBS 10737]